jgi:ArsR family transcriptional regulator, cadmium/lead-responsive transcriptional repressor
MARQATPLTAPGPDRDSITAKFFRALGHPTRIRILLLLMERERTVGELVEELDAFQARVSSHLGCLRWCGLVEVRRDGRRAYYRADDVRVRELLALANGFLDENADRIELCQVIDLDAEST